MATEAQTEFPRYVTDGSHIYLWHPEYAQMLQDGRLRPSDPPPPRVAKPPTPREKAKLDAMRKKALKDAEDAVKLLQSAVASGVDTTELFGAEPK